MFFFSSNCEPQESVLFLDLKVVAILKPLEFLFGIDRVEYACGHTCPDSAEDPKKGAF